MSKIKTPEDHIVTSQLDNDFYNSLMCQLFLLKTLPRFGLSLGQIRVKFQLQIRTKGIPITKYVPEQELREEIEWAISVRLNRSEEHYYRGTNEYDDRMFREETIGYWRTMHLVPLEINLKAEGDNYNLTIEGPIERMIFVEVPSLFCFTEIYYRHVLAEMTPLERDAVTASGNLRLLESFNILKENPDITVAGFDTRRRFSKDRQEYVTRMAAQELGEQFRGTSNTMFAQMFGIMPIGTSSHAAQMIYAGILEALFGVDAIPSALNMMLEDWWDLYGWGLSIFLPDTWTSEFFRRTVPPEIARKWKGFRVDSEDPIIACPKWRDWYTCHGVDSKDRLALPSDGLSVPKMVAVRDAIREYFKYSFGWGGGLGNNMGNPTGHPFMMPISIVMKPIEIIIGDKRVGLVKIGDNPAKASGTRADIAKYVRVLNLDIDSLVYKACEY
ncbi:MAG: hypothetical protein WC797_02175 [Candidatus Paceibacterota bacterium]|jgi:nicotinate phosphoribosyltransferase